MPGFLSLPRTPLHLRWSKATIWHKFDLPVTQAPRYHSYATGPVIGAVNQTELRAAAEDMDARVLHIGNLQPGMFTGFDEEADNVVFNEWFHRMMYDMKWCCSTEVIELKQKRYDGIDFEPSAPFPTSGAAAFKVRYVCSLQEVRMRKADSHSMWCGWLIANRCQQMPAGRGSCRCRDVNNLSRCVQMPLFKLPAYCADSRVRVMLEREFNQPLKHSSHPCNLFAEPLAVPEWDDKLWTQLLSLLQQQDLWPFDVRS
jgi:hypothetical protein